MSHFVQLLILIASPTGTSPLLVLLVGVLPFVTVSCLPLPPTCLLFFKHSWVGLFLGLFLNIYGAVRLAQPRLKRFQIETRFTARNINHTILFPRYVILVLIYKIILNKLNKNYIYVEIWYKDLFLCFCSYLVLHFGVQNSKSIAENVSN